ncbi:MAG TPA: hypothetical protein VEQ63_13650 [Bryobacteraceae bacterium]|nr:hypothetical protein [Bryobacteraceae bacterium]
MIVYADRQEVVDTRQFLRTIEEAGDPLERFIRFGQLETGIMDALCPEADTESRTSARLRRIALGQDEIHQLHGLQIPERVSIRTPEGYSLYSLYPDQYTAAAERFFEETKPRACVVIGIRSIGASLSAAVARALMERGVLVWSFTVRPHGHAFDRELRVSSNLAASIEAHSGLPFCIVDEGPGISGSSFASVAAKLTELGVPDNNIFLFPSHCPDPAMLKSKKAQRAWKLHKVYTEPFQPYSYVPADARDLSGGLWREVTGIDPPVQPQHERRKYLQGDSLWKFEGLAHLGRQRLERAQRLADAGFSPGALRFENGFVVYRWITGPAGMEVPDMVDFLARYLSFLRSEYSTGRPVEYERLAQMMEVNAQLPALASSSLVSDQETVAIDGRMLAHEWIGGLKTDSVHHHDDHFFPGCQDIAWDIAAASIEMDLPLRALAESYSRITPDSTLQARLPFYKRAYLAYRIGYTQMAMDALPGSSDGLAFAELNRRYTAALVETNFDPANSPT